MQQISVLIFFLFSFMGYGQNLHKLSGLVVDTNNLPVAIGDVLLFAGQNETPIQFAVMTDGKFELEPLVEGTYRLTISCLGYATYEQEITLNHRMTLTIRLIESTTSLDEVEVVASKPMFSNENGNIKMNVENPIFSSIPEPLELLTKFPGIQVSPDKESIAVLGKGAPLIYVGNQRISLEELNAMSVADINSIEVIKNPSSKYEAEGRAVVLITRKISDTEGLKFDFSETLSFKQNFNNYNGLSGSFKKKKLVLKTNFAYNDLQTWESQTFAFAIPEHDIFSEYLFLIDKNERVQINTGGGLLYQINDTDYFSVNTNIRLQSNKFPIHTETFLRQQAQEDFIVTKSGNDNTRDFFSGNFNYNKKLFPGLSLFTGLQYSSYVQKFYTDISNNVNETELIISEERQQKYRIDVLAYRLDLERVFDNGFKWEMGANVSNAKANAMTDIRSFEPVGSTMVDFDYSESTYSSYSGISGSIRKNINFSTGVRIENNQVQGETETSDFPLVNRKNTQFFPKAMLNIELDSTKGLTFNYSKSIERPDYSSASSIRVFINPFLEGSGNANLLPTTTDEISANFQIRQKSISINYLQKKNPMYFTIGYDKDDTGKAIFSLRNLEQESGLDISLNLPMTKGKWTANNLVMLSTRNSKDSAALRNASKPYLYVYTDHQFKIGKDTTLSLGGWGLTRRSEGIFTRNGIVSLNAAISMTFFDNLDCSLRLNDIAKGQNFGESYSINGVNANGIYFADAQEVALSIKYSLGKIKEPGYKNRDVDESLDRIE